MCRSCGAEANGRSYCKRCLARISERHWALREEVLNAYGAKCACCGESELRFLQIDHIHDDGSKHRAELGAASQTMLRWIKKNGFPKDRLRVLCANCNLGRHLNGGVCPHQIRE